MPNVHNDWAWKPDALVSERLRRGQAKVRAAQLEARETIININAVKRRKISQRELLRREKETVQVRRYLARRQPVSVHSTIGGLRMTWATVILLDGAKTRPFNRYNSLELACRAAECEPEAMKAPDYLVISAGSDLKILEEKELAALLKAAGGGQLERTAAESFVKKFLAGYEEEQTELTPAGLKNAGTPEKAALLGKATKEAKPNGVTPPAAKAKGKKTAAAPAPAPAPKKGKVKKTKTTPPAKSRKKSNGDGLGREGTVTRFMCEAILAGKMTDEQLLAAARKKFNKNKIGDGYPKWYRNKLIKDGLLEK